jgi:hypothetical protein
VASKFSKLNLYYRGDESDPRQPRNERWCPKCDKQFVITKLYQIFCSDDCENHYNNVVVELDNKRSNSQCEICQCSIRLTAAQHRRCEGCKYTQRKKFVEKEFIQRNLKRNESGEKRKKGLSLVELDRRAEYKRVFDDAGWDHYLKGRKWDKI